MNLTEHQSALAAAGRLDPAQAVPERNSRVWAEHAALCAAFGVSEAERPVVAATAAGLAAWRDDPTEAYTLAGLDCVSDPCLSYTAAELIAGLPALIEALVAVAGPEARLVTDTFALPAPPSADERRHLLWLQSPIARIPARAEDYLPTLSRRRSQRLRRARAALGGEALQVTIESRPASDGELERVAAWQSHRFGEDGLGYALRQHLFVAAAGRVLPEATLTLRARWQGELVLVAGYIVRGETVTSQATARHPALCPSDLGTLVDALLVEHLAGGPLAALDPTCRLSLGDPPSIGVAKRAVVNADHQKPLLVAGAVVPEAPAGAPCFDPAGGWSLPAEPLVVGDPA